MTVTSPPAPAGVVPTGRRRPAGRRATRVNAGQSRYGYLFVSGYTLLLLAFGLLPTLYAVYLAFTRNGAFVGVDNFVGSSTTTGSCRPWPTSRCTCSSGS